MTCQVTGRQQLDEERVWPNIATHKQIPDGHGSTPRHEVARGSWGEVLVGVWKVARVVESEFEKFFEHSNALCPCDVTLMRETFTRPEGDKHLFRTQCLHERRDLGAITSCERVVERAKTSGRLNLVGFGVPCVAVTFGICLFVSSRHNTDSLWGHMDTLWKK